MPEPSQVTDLLQAFAAVFTALAMLVGGVATLVKALRGRRDDDAPDS